jgi:uncharacterized protein YehS (DUF1456 family)
MDKNNITTDAEAQDIENLLTELRAKKKKYEQDLQEVNTTINLLQRFQSKSGERELYVPTSGKKKGIPNHIKTFLEGKELHVEDIFKILTEQGFTTTRKSLTALLWSYAKNGKIFRKAGPNIYGLIKLENHTESKI